MSTLRDRAIDEHIIKNYPNSKILNYNDPDSDLVFYSAEELQSVDEDWFPLCCYKNEETGQAMYGGRKNVFHTYTEGETGAGKTTRFVMQSILALSSLKKKPSFVIVDIHGEIIENLYGHLQKNGYSVKVLNCDNPQRSDTYNPFSELAQECLQSKTISNDAINKIRRISEIIQPVESKNDPIWERGARSYTNGCILDKFEDLIKGDIPVECLTIYNVIQNHYWLREALSKSIREADLFRIPHYKQKGSQALSTQKMISVTNNADRTRSSYFGVVENHYDIFGQPSLYSLSSNNTIDIQDFFNNPTVIVIQSGSTKIGDDLISLLVNDIYTQVVKVGKESPTKRLPRNIHCFLDEFANCDIADGPEYIKMLTTSRKFGMFWHMILQCDAQLDRKYDPNIGRIIRANCTEIFMGSHDYETEVRFAKSCGQKTIESLASVFAQQDPRLDVVDLMTTERLNLTEEGYVYIKSNRHPLTKTYIEAFYNCDEFVPVDDIGSVYPYNEFDYQQTLFYPNDLPPIISAVEYDILSYIQVNKVFLQDVIAHFPMYDVDKAIKILVQKNIVEILGDQTVKSNVTQRQFSLYQYRDEYGLNSSTLVEPEKVEKPSIKKGGSLDSKTQKDETDDSEGYFKNVGILNNPFYTDLKDHLKQMETKDILEKMKKYTCIPDFLSAAVERIISSNGAEEKGELNDIPFPRKFAILKYEILTKYLSSHNFDNKDMWDLKAQEEYDMLKGENFFPNSIMSAFKNMPLEIQRGLTMYQIREIKKIISHDSSEEDGCD